MGTPLEDLVKVFYEFVHISDRYQDLRMDRQLSQLEGTNNKHIENLQFEIEALKQKVREAECLIELDKRYYKDTLCSVRNALEKVNKGGYAKAMKLLDDAIGDV